MRQAFYFQKISQREIGGAFEYLTYIMKRNGNSMNKSLCPSQASLLPSHPRLQQDRMPAVPRRNMNQVRRFVIQDSGDYYS